MTKPGDLQQGQSDDYHHNVRPLEIAELAFCKFNPNALLRQLVTRTCVRPSLKSRVLIEIKSALDDNIKRNTRDRVAAGLAV